MIKLKGNVATIGSPIMKDTANFQKFILTDLSKKFNFALYSIASSPTVTKQVGSIIENSVRASGEYPSLLNGKLRAEFGLVNPEAAVDSVIEAIQNSVKIQVEPIKVIGTRLVGGVLTVQFLSNDMHEVLRIPEGSFESEGGKVDWLNWLLTQGDRVVLSEYAVNEFLGTVSSKDSRTGDALMVKSKRGYRVPPEYSGTINNNWLTRAFDEGESSLLICNVLISELKRRV